MPELPEVETIKNDLESNIKGLKILGIEALWPGIIKNVPENVFAKAVVGQEIVGVQRRAKNLIIKLSGGLNLLIHLKMTGHLIVTDDDNEISKEGRWVKSNNDNLKKDAQNQFIRLIFKLSNNKILAFSDLRKFAYIKLMDEGELKGHLDQYGIEPFDPNFKVAALKDTLKDKKGPIKKVLMDQTVISGIGNIYADEVLWKTKIHPKTPAQVLDEKAISDLHKNIQATLKEAIEKRGTSTSDFRDTRGEKGSFGDVLNAYRRTGLPCPRCGIPISRISLGGRGTHFCPQCQKESK